VCYIRETKSLQSMHIDKIKNKGQGRLFQSEYLEMMTKTHPVVIYSLYIPVVIFLLYYGLNYRLMSVGSVVLYFLGGMLAWSLMEYVLHRFVFHFVSENPKLQRVVYKLHGIHHEYPRDRERLFMPPVPSLIVATFFFSVQYLIFGWNVLGFFPGFLTGYLLYGTMHYAIHAFTPPSFLKALWRNHHLHHYKYPEKGFGVSSVLWDHIFRTVPPKK
jgi:4-hydroxysphinganine ceramide fatty acyl 2-hydroxylase